MGTKIMNKLYPLILSVLVFGLARCQINAAATVALPHASVTSAIGRFFAKTHAAVTLENTVCCIGVLALLRNIIYTQYAKKLRSETLAKSEHRDRLEKIDFAFGATLLIGAWGALITVSVPPTVGAVKALARFSMPTAHQIAPLAVALTGLLALSREKVGSIITSLVHNSVCYKLWRIEEQASNNLQRLTSGAKES